MASNPVSPIREIPAQEKQIPAQEQQGGAVTGAQVFLQPVAAPSILGLYGFAGATFMVAAHMAHWFGGTQTDLVLFPFAAFFGGLAQFLAGMWAYKARDGVATAMHGMWGAFWMAFGVLELLVVAGKVAMPAAGAAFPALGFWFVVLAAITWAGMVAASAESSVVSTLLGFLALGSTLAAISDLAGVAVLNIIAAYAFIIAALMAWYAATALMVNGAFGRTAMGLGVPKREAQLQPGYGEPGVLRGQ